MDEEHLQAAAALAAWVAIGRMAVEAAPDAAVDDEAGTARGHEPMMTLGRASSSAPTSVSSSAATSAAVRHLGGGVRRRATGA
jgi:hypothetical protein